ncbi:MAG TPA: SHOCT domain-containing protein [Clostridia bacterium]|nr:SHOCT domain-containing protein [Clostridia bacterium]
MEQLEHLAKLKENGAITQEEYDENKKSLPEKIG